jgi:carbamoyl-phosphate synthase small subunit
LQNKGARVTVVPATTAAEEILALDPSGIVISNGPGNPKDVSADVVATVKALAGKKPMLGVALGHQVIALALGADTKKLKFGHRGANQPVKDLANGRVYIMSENYSYVVDEASLAGTELEVLQKNVNDDSVEALRHKSLPIFTIQYYQEANVETADNYEVVGQFWALMEKGE